MIVGWNLSETMLTEDTGKSDETDQSNPEQSDHLNFWRRFSKYAGESHATKLTLFF
jgi:hypothetical protein